MSTSGERAATAAQSESIVASSSAPLYITIGPPCSGKTTWLKQHPSQKAVVDISLDDQPNVYVPIPAQLFSASADTILEKNGLSPELQQLLQTSIYQKTVQQRLLSADMQELRWVLQRLSGKTSKDELEKSLRSLNVATKDNSDTNNQQSGLQQENTQNTSSTKSHSDERVVTLLESVERAVAQQQETSVSPLPETVDLFVVEALFQKNPDPTQDNNNSNNNSWTGIQRATNLLRQTPNTTSVAWGNTNTKPRDYTEALEIAQQQGRQVYFCIFDSGTHDGSESLFQLPHASYSQLMDRNIQRLVETGRYVPSKAIWDASQRVEKFIRDAVRQARDHKSRSAPEDEITQLDLDRQLARLARFDMHKDRTVSKMKVAPRNYRNSNAWSSQPWRQPANQNRTSTGQSPSRRSYTGPSQQQNGPHGHQNHQPYEPQYRLIPPARRQHGNFNSGRDNRGPPATGGGNLQASSGYRHPESQTQNYQPRDKNPRSSAWGSRDDGRTNKRSRGED